MDQINLVRLKQANKSMNKLLKRAPRQQIQDGTSQELSALIKCANCHFYQAEIYKLKHQNYRLGTGSNQEHNAQVDALKQLYTLKCQQAEILQRKLREHERHLAEVQLRVRDFKRDSLQNLMSVGRAD